MNRRIALFAVAVLALVTSACSSTVTGRALPAGTAAGYGQGPVIPDEPADWAASALDPCTLLRGSSLGAKGDPFPTKPHNCAIDFTTSGGKPDRLVVRVGMAFDTGDRARGLPATVGGLVAFQSRDREEKGYEPSVCLVDIPISATRSIQVVTTSLGGSVEASCAGTRAAAEPIAAKLADPGSLARTSPPMSLDRWDACALLEKALGYQADRSALGSEGADQCKAGPVGSESPLVEIETTAAPELDEPGKGDTTIQLPLGPAVQKPYGSFCDIETIVGRTPGAPKDAAVQVMTLRQRATNDVCGDAAQAATKIQNTLKSTPAPSVPAPARLGFPPGVPNDVMPTPCGTFSSSPATCRAPRPVEVPAGAREIMKVGSSGAIAPDVSCAIVQAAATPVLGEIELAAQGEASCVAMADGYTVDLGFFDSAAAQEYFDEPEFGRQDAQVAGRAGIALPGDVKYQLVLPAIGTTAADKGVILVEGRLLNNRGDRSIDQPKDSTKVKDLTTRITENAITKFLAR